MSLFNYRDDLTTPASVSNGTASNSTGSHYLNIVKSLSNVTRNAGETIRLKCEFAGSPQPKVTWYKHEAPIEPEKGKTQIKFRRTGGANSDRVLARLIINKLDTHDSGFYKCEASNGYKTVESIGVLMVKAGMFIHKT